VDEEYNRENCRCRNPHCRWCFCPACICAGLGAHSNITDVWGQPLSALSTQVVDAIFGENPQEEGVISFGGQTIEFFRSLDSVTLTISDDNTGDETRIVVPLFVDIN